MTLSFPRRACLEDGVWDKVEDIAALQRYEQDGRADEKHLRRTLGTSEPFPFPLPPPGPPLFLLLLDPAFPTVSSSGVSSAGGFLVRPLELLVEHLLGSLDPVRWPPGVFEVCVLIGRMQHWVEQSAGIVEDAIPTENSLRAK